MARNDKVPKVKLGRAVRSMSHALREQVEQKLGSDATFEEFADTAFEMMREVYWLCEEMKLKDARTTTDEVEVAGVRYRKMGQPSSAVYFGRFGAHEVVEPLYRQVGVHNGLTVKPLEAKVGIIGNMTPDLARIVAEHGADENSRETERRMKIDGLQPPSRAFLAKHQAEIAHDVKCQVVRLESAARDAAPARTDVATVSCGMDRMAVRMVEPAGPEAQPRPARSEPYERKQPDPKEYPYRMAWVGSVSTYDDAGVLQHTWRFAMDASARPEQMARRITAQVKALTEANPRAKVYCIQDGAPELEALPSLLEETLGPHTEVTHLTDIEHLMGYVEDAVDAVVPEGDPWNHKDWFRQALLRDDDGIDRFWSWLVRKENSKGARSRTAEQAKAIYDAKSYIEDRKDRMRYASHRADSRPIGSGETENTVGLMQLRVKRRGQSWEVPGLSGILSLRSLVLSESWKGAWKAFSATHRKEVKSVH